MAHAGSLTPAVQGILSRISTYPTTGTENFSDSLRSPENLYCPQILAGVISTG